ncbi:hypothetical protein CQW23_17030 [Capsicum baccatum]|uniref:Pentatricopeptide repeat-containing protein n=1 Tax=Capsicum baccatum TaxID=33114 RepID=A0A2G2WCM3_CAPBA|nr:hypothetical protein CQW23_17030 [Capsicum baccatum]
MSANLLRTLLRKLEPVFAVPFDLDTSPTANHLRSCHSLAALKWLHAVVLTTGHYANVPNHSVVSWNAIITAYEQKDIGFVTVKLFYKMLDQGIEFDYITVVTVISACARLGELCTGKWVHELVKRKALVEEGRKHFKSRKIEYSIVPGVEPYACTVYLLGQAGQLLEAYEFLEKMTIEPDANVSGAMLDACRIHGNLELAESVADQLFDLNPLTVLSTY